MIISDKLGKIFCTWMAFVYVALAGDFFEPILVLPPHADIAIRVMLLFQ